MSAAAADVIAGPNQQVHGGMAVVGFQMVGDAGAVVGPVVAGAVVERAGYAAGFATTAVIATVAFGCWLRAPETRPR